MAPNRRAIVTGLAALSVSTSTNMTATAAATSVAPDHDSSIQAAIARHRDALLQWMAALLVESETNPRDPTFDAAAQATSDAWDRYEAAERELLGFELTTRADVLALQAYIEDFNGGGVQLSGVDAERGFRSGPDEWADPDTFAFTALGNIKAALQRLI